MHIRLLMLLFLCLSGCALSPIPKNIEQQRIIAHQRRNSIEHLLRPGDIIFRLGDARVSGGRINFSELVAKISASDFSHAVIVYKIVDGEAIILDVSAQGLQRFFLIDWFMDGQKNIVVKRLKPEYQKFLPLIMKQVELLIMDDPLYDDKFGTLDNRFYCTEAVDHCFREAGLPLAKRVPIRELPNFYETRIFANISAAIAGIDLNTPVVIAGNDEVGLFSSPYLEIVIDLRDR